jgi:hypothetical protein
VDLIMVATARVSQSLSDSTDSALRRDAERLAVWLKTGRAHSRPQGAPAVRPTQASRTRFEFSGLPHSVLPRIWLDSHIELHERHSSVRFRIDGTPRMVVQPNWALHAALISRLKIMAELNIAEKSLPQDGRISLRLGSLVVDVCVATLPSAYGERRHHHCHRLAAHDA